MSCMFHSATKFNQILNRKFSNITSLYQKETIDIYCNFLYNFIKSANCAYMFFFYYSLPYILLL